MARERRGFARLYVGVEAVYKQEDKENTVLVQDISVSGVRFIASEILDLSREVSFSLSIPGLSKVIIAKGKVSWQKKFSESFYDTGLEFSHMDSESRVILAAYIKNALGRVDEHRIYVRSNLSTMIIYKMQSKPDEEKRCISVDISPTGMKVFARELIKSDEILELSFTLPEDENPIEVQGKVMWIKDREENFSECGIEFTSIDDESISKINSYVKQTLGIEW